LGVDVFCNFERGGAIDVGEEDVGAFRGELEGGFEADPTGVAKGVKGDDAMRTAKGGGRREGKEGWRGRQAVEFSWCKNVEERQTSRRR